MPQYSCVLANATETKIPLFYERFVSVVSSKDNLTESVCLNSGGESEMNDELFADLHIYANASTTQLKEAPLWLILNYSDVCCTLLC